MSTVLVVAYHYPPEEGSCSEKNVRIVRELLDNDYSVVILTKSDGSTQKIINENNYTIIRTDNNGIFHRNTISASGISIPQKKSLNRKIKRKISDAIIPDSVVDWIPEVKKTYHKYLDIFNKCDVILSISSPYSAHLVSAHLSKKLDVPMVMCYGDPWIYEPKRKRGIIRYNIEKRMEKGLLLRAKEILLITEWNKKKYHQLYEIPLDKISTYHIGYDGSEVLASAQHRESMTLKIIYGGSLDKVHRNPEPFIRAMSKINGNIIAYIYNSDNENVSRLIKKYGVEDRVILKPLINSKEFYKKLYEMDVLLLFGNKTPFQVPGKIFTYISTKKTILYIKNNDSDADGTKKILNDYGNSLIVNNNSEEIIKCIKNLKNKTSFDINVNAEKFEFHNTMQPIVDVLKNLN